VLEGDRSAATPMVLCVSAVRQWGGGVPPPRDDAAGGKAGPGDDFGTPAEVELTDGWYWVRALCRGECERRHTTLHTPRKRPRNVSRSGNQSRDILTASTHCHKAFQVNRFESHRTHALQALHKVDTKCTAP
jgi:hypothetical protein